mgnify:CR=1 FL=1
MAKKVMTMIKLQVEAGKANPSPPIGPALGQHGVNIGEFVKKAAGAVAAVAMATGGRHAPGSPRRAGRSCAAGGTRPPPITMHGRLRMSRLTG